LKLEDRDVCAQIGSALRQLRQGKRLNVTQLASISGVSSGMISRVENGQVSPSLATLDALAQGLNVQLMSLFAHTSNSSDIYYVPEGEGLNARRISPSHAHEFVLLGIHADANGIFSSASVVIRREELGKPPQYQHEGYVFNYIVSGQATYACGAETFELSKGVSISFDAKLPHGFVEIHSEEVHMLTVSTRPV
jgi:transcriptional regulator with XRE-family HTH domain